MSDTKSLHPDESKLVIDLAVRMFGVLSPSERKKVTEEIQNRLSASKDNCSKDFQESLERLLSFYIKPQDWDPTRYTIRNKRTQIGAMLPKFFNEFHEQISEERVATEIKNLFSTRELKTIEIGKGAIQVDKVEDVLDIAQMVNILEWWHSPRAFSDNRLDSPLRKLRKELEYRVFKYHRFSESLEAIIRNQLRDVNIIDNIPDGESFVHDAQSGHLSRNCLSDIALELTDELEQAFEKILSIIKNSPASVSQGIFSKIVVDLVSRADEESFTDRPAIAFLGIMLMKEIFHLLPHSPMEGVYVPFESAFIYVIGNALESGLGTERPKESAYTTAGHLVANDLGVSESRMQSIASSLCDTRFGGMFLPTHEIIEYYEMIEQEATNEATKT